MADRNRLFVIGALLALWLAMALLGAGAGDREVLLALYAADEPWLALAGIAFTYLGNWATAVGVTLAGALLLLWRGRRFEALLLLVATFSGRLLIILEKQWFARIRPEEHLRLVEVHYLSFPSGHAANSVLVYVGLAFLAFDKETRWRPWAVAAALLLAFCIGLSRPILGVHWPSDVIGGWAFGGLWLMLVLWLGDRLASRAAARR